MNTYKFIDLLNKEREYHTTHPNQVYGKTLSAIGASLAAVFASIYFSGKDSQKELATYLQVTPIVVPLCLFGLGLLVILIGLAEHSHLHIQQRKKIEDSLNGILQHGESFKFSEFWENHKSHQLYSLFNKPLKKETPLFTHEPDTRSYWRFHDRMFDLGGILIISAYAIMIAYALLK